MYDNRAHTNKTILPTNFHADHSRFASRQPVAEKCDLAWQGEHQRQICAMTYTQVRKQEHAMIA